MRTSKDISREELEEKAKYRFVNDEGDADIPVEEEVNGEREPVYTANSLGSF